MTWKLKRLKQCEKCPWKVGVDPNEIPNGYSHDLHRSLQRTIATPGQPTAATCDLRVMACHDSEIGDEAHCIGWLNHQLGIGNNIPLRIRMRSCENAHLIQVDGPQHEKFEDTLPTGK